MKLLLAIKTLALPGGGTERVLADLAGTLVERGHQVTVASFDRPEEPPFYRFHPAVTRRPLAIGDIRRGTRGSELPRRIGGLRRLLRETRPDVAVGFMHSAYIPLGLAAAGTGIPVVASEHIAYQHYRTRPLQAALLRLTPWISGTMTTISPAIREGFPRRLREGMVVVPNPVTVHGRRAADVAGEGREWKTILAVGRLEPQKDHATLVAAFAQLAGEFADWRLRIVGEGSLRAELEDQVARLGLQARVSLPGATPCVDDEYVEAQLFAMPSSYESFGLATAEALSHGLPVVGFADCPGTNELVKHGVNGLLAHGEERAKALAEALATLMRSPQRRRELGAAGPPSVQPFAPERIADIWERLLSRFETAKEQP